MLKFLKIKVSKKLKKKLNKTAKDLNSEIKKAWKEYSKDRMFDDPCEELKAERAYKDGFYAGYLRGAINNEKN